MERTPTYLQNFNLSGNVQKILRNHFHLELIKSKETRYQLGQIDDYKNVVRRAFPHYPPLHISLDAQVSYSELPGTWGFGLWNDPFSLSLGISGGVRRFPALPNAAWFFYASPPNHLAFRDKVPSQGYMGATFRTDKKWNFTIPFAGPGFPFLFWQFSAKFLRKLVSKVVQQDVIQLRVETTEWHTYEIIWETERTAFIIDGVEVYTTRLSPIGPLGLVIWIDNQFASFAPNDILRFGVLPVSTNLWLNVKNINIKKIK